MIDSNEQGQLAKGTVEGGRLALVDLCALGGTLRLEAGVVVVALTNTRKVEAYQEGSALELNIEHS